VTSAVVAWAGFAGAWLLVAGPVYQAAIELEAEEIERDAIRGAAQAIPGPPPFSRWWWLIPPVGYALGVRRRRAQRRELMHVLTPAQMGQLVRYANKSTGWILIASGAFLVALKETWSPKEIYRWPVPVYVLVVVLMLVACALITLVRQRRTHDIMTQLGSGPAPAPAAQAPPQRDP
jgi:hypothetical protein